METYEQKAKALAEKVLDEGPSYPHASVIWQFLNKAAREGLITLHFTPPGPGAEVGQPPFPTPDDDSLAEFNESLTLSAGQE